jgi:hypothetical protein
MTCRAESEANRREGMNHPQGSGIFFAQDYCRLSPLYMLGSTNITLFPNRPARCRHLLGAGLLRLERRHIDRESVLHIGLHHSLVGFVDLLDRNDFHIGGDVVVAAEIEHLLGFSDAADRRAGEPAARGDQAEGGDSQGLCGCADQSEVSVKGEQVEIGVDVVRGRDAAEDEIEATGLLLSFVFIQCLIPMKRPLSCISSIVTRAHSCGPSRRYVLQMKMLPAIYPHRRGSCFGHQYLLRLGRILQPY